MNLDRRSAGVSKASAAASVLHPDAVAAAQARIAPYIHRTPLLRCALLDAGLRAAALADGWEVVYQGSHWWFSHSTWTRPGRRRLHQRKAAVALATEVQQQQQAKGSKGKAKLGARGGVGKRGRK